MLVLSRKIGDKIRIGEAVTLTVVNMIGNRVRLVIDAPADCRVRREEIAPRTQEWTLESPAEAATLAFSGTRM